MGSRTREIDRRPAQRAVAASRVGPRRERETIAPAIWLEWFDAYRGGLGRVAGRAASRRSTVVGFWGTGAADARCSSADARTSRSAWFGDKSTPEREGRDEIAVRSFAKAVARSRNWRGRGALGGTASAYFESRRSPARKRRAPASRYRASF
jgi:hypothetical protein